MSRQLNERARYREHPSSSHLPSPSVICRTRRSGPDANPTSQSAMRPIVPLLRLVNKFLLLSLQLRLRGGYYYQTSRIPGSGPLSQSGFSLLSAQSARPLSEMEVGAGTDHCAASIRVHLFRILRNKSSSMIVEPSSKYHPGHYGSAPKIPLGFLRVIDAPALISVFCRFRLF